MKKTNIFILIMLLFPFFLIAQTDADVNEEPLHNQLLFSFHGSYAVPVNEYGELVSPSYKGGEIKGYYTLVDFSGLFLILNFGANYMLHNHVPERDTEVDLHLIGLHTGVSIMFHPSFTDKLGIYLDGGGGYILSLLESELYDTVFFSFDPTLFCSVGIRYRFFKFFDIGVKATYRAFFYIYDLLHYMEVSAGFGIYL